MHNGSPDRDETFAGLPPHLASWLARAAASLRAGDLDAGLTLLRDGVKGFNDARLGIGVVFGCREMDAVCLEAGRAIRPARETTERNGSPAAMSSSREKIVYLLTELYATGGHSRVVEDLIIAKPNADHLIIVTDILDTQSASVVSSSLRVPCRIVKLATRRPADKLSELADLLDHERPNQIIHLGHHFDSVATAIMQPDRFAAHLLYIHHADHNLALGLFLPGVTHVDLHPRGLHICRNHLGLHASYLPMACRTEPRPSRTLPTFVSATCGTYGKFSGEAPMTFEEMIVTRLETRDGFHVHIGAVPPEAEDSLRARCEAAGIDPTRFINIPFVDDVAQALATLACDLYIVSFPVGGGKAILEAMAAGVGVLCYGRPDFQLLCGIDIAYPEALVWRTKLEFKLILEQYDNSTREAHRAFARDYFAKHHSFPIMATQWSSLLNRDGDALVPPSIKPFRGSPLAGFDFPNFP